MRSTRHVALLLTTKHNKLVSVFTAKNYNNATTTKHNHAKFIHALSNRPKNQTMDITRALYFAEDSTSLLLGGRTHGVAVKMGFTNDVYIYNNLIKMYVKLGSLCDGVKVFDEMLERNVVSWTLLVSGGVQCGEFLFGFECFLGMVRAGLLPNEFSLASIMKACAEEQEGVKGFGFGVHCLVMKIGMERNPFVASSILSFYAKLDDVEAVENVFIGVDDPDVCCWNALLAAYVQCGCGVEAMSNACHMQRAGVDLDRYTLVAALQGCSLAGDVNFGRQIHGFIYKREMKYCTLVVNPLIDMYFNVSQVDTALKVFKMTSDRDVVTWNTLFGKFSQFEDPSTITSFFHEFMATRTHPNRITFSVLFRECGEIHNMSLGLQYFGLALRFGLAHEANVIGPFISMLMKCGAIEMARLMFDRLESKDITCWNELILSYHNNYCDSEAMETFSTLFQLAIKPNEYTFSIILETCLRCEAHQTSREIHGSVLKSGLASHGYIISSLVKGYIKFGLLGDSFEFFNNREILDITIWGSMISMLVQQGYDNEAMSSLKSLIKVGLKPDNFILGSILNSCAHITAYNRIRFCHPLVIKLGYGRHTFVACAILDAYAKCSDIECARLSFDQCGTLNNDIIIYNAMIMAYAHHGLILEALKVFDKIKLARKLPNEATFTSLLSACSHMGYVEQGRLLFERMVSEYKIEPSPDNYGCLVDLYSRNGKLEDAKHVIEMMPFRPWLGILRSFLSGCRTHGNKKMGQWVAGKLLELDHEDDATYMMLCEVSGDGSCFEDLRREIMERGVRKVPGQSWIII